MKGLFRAAPNQVQPYVTPEHWSTMSNIIHLTDPLYIGLWDSQLVCLVGLVPRSLLSDTAYLWLYDTPLVRQHRIAVARHAIRLVREWRKTWHLEGHCINPESWPWLRSLGAVLTSDTTFEIV